MIQNQENIEYIKDQEELTKQISQFKRINACLRRKIQARDKKISYLFPAMEPMSKSSLQPIFDDGNIKKNRSEINHNIKQRKDVCFTQPKKYEKQNNGSMQHNIFKQRDIEHINASLRISLKLPALQRKTTISQNPQSNQSRPKIIKVPREKLIPLKHQDVRKKFQSKFK